MSNRCVISGLGMATSIGCGPYESAASVRAGINRFQSVDEIMVYDEDELEAPITGAPVSLLTQGFVQQARLLRLVEFAFKDLIANTEIDPSNNAFWEVMPVIWILPDFAEAFSWPEDQVGELLQRFIVDPLAKRFNISLVTPPNGVFFEGASGGARALRAVARSFEGNHLSRAICVSVDSLLEPMRLQRYFQEGRIKFSDNPVGLIPGEAAAVLLLESSNACQQRGQVPQAKIYQTVHQQLQFDTDEKHWWATAAPVIGKTLGNAIIQVLSIFKDQTFFGDIYLDLNGEEWRAVVWGSALVQLQGFKGIDLDLCKEVFSATNWGDIGVASGIANTCLTVRSFTRRYAKSPYALVCSVSENGNIGVILVGK